MKTYVVVGAQSVSNVRGYEDEVMFVKSSTVVSGIKMLDEMATEMKEADEPYTRLNDFILIVGEL